MATTTYYAWKLYNLQGTSGETKSVHRVVKDGDSVVMERFDPATGEWVHNPGLAKLSGIGGDHNYEEITQAEADAFMKG